MSRPVIWCLFILMFSFPVRDAAAQSAIELPGDSLRAGSDRDLKKLREELAAAIAEMRKSREREPPPLPTGPGGETRPTVDAPQPAHSVVPGAGLIIPGLTLGSANAGSPAASPPTGPLSPDPILTDEKVVEARRRLAVAAIEREIEKYGEIRAELLYTNWIGRFIFVVAHLVLGMGLWMSMHEFRAANARRREAKTVTQQELSISMEGVALKTTLHGTFIMVLALVFYFLYLKFVFPVVVVGGGATSG